ncbi:hypothetical protein DEH84_18200 (plasmid) [Aquabacterium olei]|uniref:histidine kinase n=1 Tax=Aquabacterium olei TaxID=1296669 RepID=A0A2U8FX94_9BURK|nr:MHYT domain-containing protein [Aquabacterium olei]AWI55517.1 hypothetical protein DEH84_18200 [Aquabacterium olei]
MDFAHTFFVRDVDPVLLLPGSHDLWLVGLSVLVAIFSSTMALQAAAQARATDSRSARLLLAAGSVSLGGGIWAMHFVGMLAFQLCVPVRYAAGPTLLSILPAVAASWVALGLLRRERITRAQLCSGGLLVGGGIGTMHYLGMAAMEMSAVLRYDPWMFIGSLVVAVGLAVLALWVRFGVADRLRGGQMVRSLVAGTVMGLAIAGMHYTGMAAARFTGERASGDVAMMGDPLPMALGVALVTVIGTGLVAAAAGLMRYRDLLKALQESTAELRAVFATGLDGMVVVDPSGAVLAFNVAAERIFGIPREEVIGKPAAELMPEPLRSEALGDFSGFARRFSDGREYHARLTARGGRPVPVRMVVRRAEEGGRLLYVASFSDVSQQMAMERTLRGREQQLGSLISNLPGVTFRLKPVNGWPVEFVSEAALSLTGHPASDFVGEAPRVRLNDLISPADATRIVTEVRAAIEQNRPFRVEFQLHHRDGSSRWVWSHGRAVKDDEDGRVTWIDGVILDVSDRRQMEEALREAKLKAEGAAQARTAFLANMSHEIRTPMNAILGFTDVVLGGPLPSDARQHLQTVRNSARSLLVLLNDILDTSKLDRGAVSLESLPYDLPALLHQVVEEQRLQARKKGLALSLDFDPTIPSVLMGDAHRLKQVLVNLLGNAVKFTEQGRVILRARQDGGWLTLSVRDTGIGIASDRLEQIFDPFTQADASMSRRYGGTGLGTTISRQLVELMGGEITAESTPGEGSTFTVRIPLQAAPAGATPAIAVHVVHTLPPLHVLVVDDVPENRNLLILLLGREGHSVVEADNGLTALACCERDRFDVVLMDLQMPELDGFDATLRLRARERAEGLPRTPVIALSASVFQEDRRKAAEAGMDGFAFKPVEFDTLMLEMARVTGHAAMLPGALPDAGETPEPEGGAALLPLIDPAQGLRRWGDAAALADALRQFGEAKRIWLDEQDPQRLPDRDAARNAGHRLRGVAANLGLPALQAAGAQLEKAAGEADDPQEPAGLHAAWTALLSVLRETLLAVHYSAREARDATQSDAMAPLPPALRHPEADELAHLMSQVTVLQQALARGEQPDALLERFIADARGVLPSDDLTALRQAIHDFDFDMGATQLQGLRARLELHSEPSQA